VGCEGVKEGESPGMRRRGGGRVMTDAVHAPLAAPRRAASARRPPRGACRAGPAARPVAVRTRACVDAGDAGEPRRGGGEAPGTLRPQPAHREALARAGETSAQSKPRPCPQPPPAAASRGALSRSGSGGGVTRGAAAGRIHTLALALRMTSRAASARALAPGSPPRRPGAAPARAPEPWAPWARPRWRGGGPSGAAVGAGRPAAAAGRCALAGRPAAAPAGRQRPRAGSARARRQLGGCRRRRPRRP
jgi:hypothetical protein